MLRTAKYVLTCLLLFSLLLPLTLSLDPAVSATELTKAPEIIKLKDPVKRGLKGPAIIPDLSQGFKKTVIAQITMQDISNDLNRDNLIGKLNYEMLPEGLEIYPHKFAIDAAENIYIPDVITNSIVIYTRVGILQKVLPIPRGKGETEVTGIDEIAIDQAGIYISNCKIIKKYDFTGKFLYTIRPHGMQSDDDVDILISQLRILPSGNLIFNVQKNWEPISTQIYDGKGTFVKTDIAYYFEVTRDRVLKVLNAALDVDQFQLYSHSESDLLHAFNLTFPDNTTRCYVDIRGNDLYFYELNEDLFLHIYAIDVTTQAKSLYLKIDKAEFVDDDRLMTDFKLTARGERFYFMQRVGNQLVIFRYGTK